MPGIVRPRVAGVDGCPGGWAVAIADADADGHGPTEVRVVPTFTDVLAMGLTAVAVDIPIGLPDGGARACDVEARRLLGSRRSSVFPAPVRPVLGSVDYPEALDRSRAASGRGLSKQAWHLVAKITEVDAAITPAGQRTVVEAHPELAFAALAGGPLGQPKRSAAGQARRLALVRALFPDATPRHAGAATHDVLDAYALATVARRLQRGVARRLGDAGRDARGLRMEIVV